MPLRVILILALLGSSLPLLGFCSERISYSGAALRGVYIDSESVAGLDTPGLEASIRRLEKRYRQRTLRVRVSDHIFRVEAARLGLKFDVPKTLARALAAGRVGSIWERFRFYWRGWSASVRIQPAFRLSSDAVAALADEWEREAIKERPNAGGIFFNAGQPEKRSPRAGWLVERQSVMKRLVGGVTDAQGNVVSLALVRVMPELGEAELEAARQQAVRWLQSGIKLKYEDPPLKLNLSREQLGRALVSHVDDSVHPNRITLSFSPASIKQYVSGPEYAVAAQDASFHVDSRERITIVPSRLAVSVVPEDIVARIEELVEKGEFEGALPVRLGEPPALTTEVARGLRIDRHLISFTTSHPCCRPRVKNIHRIADLMDGVVVLPGQTFSVNEHVGRRTVENGFVGAPSIEDGEMVETIGGGISQFATTLFNAVLRAGLDIVSRQPHSYWFTRYPMGFEATLSWPRPDLVFRNDTAAGLLIRTEYSETHIKVKLYGNTGGRQVETKVSARQNIVMPSVELVPNASLDVDEEKVAESGCVGWTVITVRRVTKDGATKEEERKVVYAPQTRRVEVHPCRIPEGEEGYTGEPCPVPADESESEDDANSEQGAERSSFPDQGATAPRIAVPESL